MAYSVCVQHIATLHTHAYTYTYTYRHTHTHTHSVCLQHIATPHTHTHIHIYIHKRYTHSYKLRLLNVLHPVGGCHDTLRRHKSRVGQNYIYIYIYIQCIYGISGREIAKYTDTYGVYIRFWPTLHKSVTRLQLQEHSCCAPQSIDRHQGYSLQNLRHTYKKGCYSLCERDASQPVNLWPSLTFSPDSCLRTASNRTGSLSL
jgi:hypothetical protein